MDEPKGFIVLTSLVDGRRVALRAESITAVYENEKQGFKPACRTVECAASAFDVTEDIECILAMISLAEI